MIEKYLEKKEVTKCKDYIPYHNLEDGVDKKRDTRNTLGEKIVTASMQNMEGEEREYISWTEAIEIVHQKDLENEVRKTKEFKAELTKIRKEKRKEINKKLPQGRRSRKKREIPEKRCKTY